MADCHKIVTLNRVKQAKISKTQRIEICLYLTAGKGI